ncbi:MAG TPA: PSD1 and planctomycete cytochrome C domain-containing protein [Planctomycetaceae bacterium]
MSLVWLAVAPGRAADPPVSAEQVKFFEKRIRPVLVEHCQSCHGEKKQEGGLRLDSRESLLKGSDGGPVVVAGKPAESDLIEAVRQTGDIKMPPKGKLAAAQIADLAQWVEMGLPWPSAAGKAGSSAEIAKTHWAFQPVRKPAIPATKDEAWPQTDIDRFILSKLESHGLAPAPAADRRTLLRRGTFDLIGLPPTPAEAAAFENDAAPLAQAFATVVERLLASSHYGERWGRYWLDVARYADNKGYIFFEEPSYPWGYAFRDWVIRAFNEDLPYDEFIRQQLAADQLPLGPDKRALAAMGYLTIGGHFMNNVHDIFDDRIDTVTRGLLGLTVSCARCHDHKYDPIPAADYYSLYGVFRSSSEPTVPPLFDRIPETEAYEYYELELAARRNKLDQFLERKYVELVTAARTRLAEYLMAAFASRDQPSTEDFMLLIPEGDIHPLVVQRYWLYLQRTKKQHDPVWAPWHALAAIPETEFIAKSGKLCEGFSAGHDGENGVNPLVAQALSSKPLQSMKEVAERYAELLGQIDRQWQELLRETAAAGQPAPVGLSDPHAEQLRQVFYGSDAPANVPRLAGWGVLTLLPDRAAQAEFQKLIKELETWMIRGPHAPQRAMVLVDDPVPYEPRIFLRGNPNRPGNHVPRQFLGFLSDKAEPFARGSGRLELARAIADRHNPLTARVFVNRVWQNHFGAGLVRTPSDFGIRSEPPSHPELLDYLAATFMEQGWSMKSLHRQIMRSAVYQQQAISDLGPVVSDAGISELENAKSIPDSRLTGVSNPKSEIPNPKSASLLDPENRLLSHKPRRRLDFEPLRDSLLAVSGTLDLSVGGPSVNLLAGSNRRTVYGFIDRLALPGLLRTFDFPSPDATSGGRDQTTVAPQALYLLNGPLALDCARKVLARPEIAGEKDYTRRIDLLYGLLFSRSPAASDRQLADEFFGPDPASRESNELWERYIHALLLTNEFAFVD